MRGRNRATPHQIAIVAVLAIALAFYLWTAGSSSPFTFGADNGDVYNLLTSGFLHGHTYLPLHVPAGLLHLPDPYDPAQNAQYTGPLHDLLLRNGHLYSAWGPTPAFVLFMPFRLSGLEMSQSFAVVVFSFVGLICAARLMHVLVRRFVPATPDWLLVVGTAGLALTNVVPFLLRRPAQYEVAISCGYCFEMAGILLVCTAVMANPLSTRRLAWGSLCLGLAIGARLPLIAGGVVGLAAATYLIRCRREPRRILIPALLPVAICLVLLGLYNDVRFGSLGNFGDRYQLAGFDVRSLKTGQFSYVLPGLFSYLLMPARFAVTFPHVFLETTALYPFPFPHGYQGSPGAFAAEPAGGLFPTMPLTLLLLALPLRWRRCAGERPALAVGAGLTALGLTVMVLLSLALPGTTQRYEVDYASELLIAATILWCLTVVSLRERRLARRLVTALGVMFTAFGSLVGVAVSFSGYYPVLMDNHPGVWNALQDFTSPLATLAAKFEGEAMISDVYSPLGVSLPGQNLATLDNSRASTWLGGGADEIVVVAPSGDHLVLRAQVELGPGVILNRPIRVRVSSAAGTVTTTPVTGATIALPIRVDEGLNRIRVELARPIPAGSSPDRLYLGAITVGR